MSDNGGKRNTSNFGGYTFINVRLSSDDRLWLQECDCEEEFPIEELFRLVSENFKVSFSYDEKNSTFICSATDKSPNSPSYKSILSGRGSNPANAWYSLAYRHFVKAKGDWQTFDTLSNDPGSVPEFQ